MAAHALALTPALSRKRERERESVVERVLPPLPLAGEGRGEGAATRRTEEPLC
jgi:hypothetical protein